MKKVGILYDNISGNTGDAAIGVSVRKILSEIGVDFEELIPGRFYAGDNETIIVGGGYLLQPSPHFFYDKFRVPGEHILNCCGIYGSPGDLHYLDDYLYVSVRSSGDREKLSYLSREVKVVPCTTMLLQDLLDFNIPIRKPSLGLQLWEGLVDEEALVEYLSRLPFHVYFLPITHYNHDYRFLGKLAAKVENSSLLPLLGPEEIFTAIGKFDYLITSSLHGAIFAYVHEVPFILYGGEEKLVFFMRDRDLAGYLFDNFDGLKSALERLQENEPDYSSALSKDFKTLDEHKQAIKDILLTRSLVVPSAGKPVEAGTGLDHPQVEPSTLNVRVLHLQKQVEDLISRLKESESKLRDAEARITELSNALQAEYAQVSRLKNALETKELQLAQIQQGIMFLLWSRYHRLADKLLGSGTRRRRCYESLLKRMRTILSQGRHGP